MTVQIQRLFVCVGALGLTATACAKKEGSASAPDAAVQKDADPPIASGPDAKPRKPDAAQAGPLDASPPPPPLKPESLPAPWKADNIGKNTSTLGADYFMVPSTTYFVLKSASLGIGGKEDSFQFVSQKVKGNAEIIVQVRNVDFTDPQAAAGVMIRASADPGAPHVFIAIGAGGLGWVQSRTTPGGDTQKDLSDRLNLKTGTTLRLLRQGNFVSAFRGDKKTWTEVAKIEIKLPDEALFGLVGTAANPDPEIISQNEFNYVRINNLVSDPALDGWYVEDLGLIGSSVIFDSGAAAVKTFGIPWSLTQEFGPYMFKEVKGDHRLTIRVRSIDDVDSGARVALMFRNGNVTTVSRSHAHAAVSVTVGQGVEFQHRVTNGATTMRAPAQAGVKAPIWLRLERIGNKFTGSYSADGKDGSWKEAGSAEFVLGDLSLGFIVNPVLNTKIAGAIVDNITLAPLGGAATDAGVSTRDAGGDK